MGGDSSKANEVPAKKGAKPVTKAVAGIKKQNQNASLQGISNFSPAYILRLQKKFESSSADYTLDAAGLRTFFNCSQRESEMLVKMLDMDGSGSVDSYEFMCAMALLAHGTLEEKSDLIFGLYDFNKSGILEQDELKALMINCMTSLNSMEGKPAPTLEQIEAKTKTLMAAMDRNNDKKISLAEFKAYVVKDKEILSILCNCEIVDKTDLGTDFGHGTGGAPDIDDDLEAECNPLGKKGAADGPLAAAEAARKAKAKDAAKEGSMFDEDEDAEGDQFMAVKPYEGVRRNMVPTGYKPSKKDMSPPEAQLDLEYVYGYRCHDTRNNLFYSHDGTKLLYHAAALGVIYDKATNTQKFFRGHTDDIHCMALHPTEPIIATGQIGRKPKLCIWNYETQEQIFMTTGPLVMGIMQVTFSPDGTKVAASSMDDKHTIAIWNWSAARKPGQAPTPLCSGVGTRGNILSLKFSNDNTTLVATAVKEVGFITFAGGKFAKKQGTGFKPAPTSVLCAAYDAQGTLYTGMFSGEIAVWSGNTISKKLPAHTARCNSLHFSNGQMISGGNDGAVHIWTAASGALTKVKSFDLKDPKIRSMKPMATSVWGKGDLTLVGTRGGEIIEFGAAGAPAVLMRAHFDGELWGLAVHPTRPEVFTFGRDGLLGVWDLATRKQSKYAKLDTPGDVVAFSNAGDLLVMGMINGSFIVLDNMLKPVTKRSDRRGKAIQCIKFSPDDAVCAVGAHDMQICTYDVKTRFKPLRRMRGCSSTIEHMDFTADSAHIMVQSKAYEVLFYNVASGAMEGSGASSLKDADWDSWTCTVGWPTEGIWQGAMDGSDVNALARSPDATCMATADDFGFVNLFSWPAPVKNASFNKNGGHSSHVTNVAFSKNTAGQKYLVSTGGEDKCIFQWKYNMDGEAACGFDEDDGAAGDQALPPFDGDGTPEPVEEEEAPAKKEEGGMFDEDDGAEGDQAGCIDFKKYAEMARPTDYKEDPHSANEPEGNLTLKHVYGYDGHSTRDNLHRSADGKICFTTAGLGVVQDPATGNQLFFNQTKEDIVSMAIHPNGDIIATGQMAAKTTEAWNKGNFKGGKLVNIMIWKASTQEKIMEIHGFHRRAVSLLGFSPDGTKLVSVGQDDYNSVAVYNWEQGALLASAKTDGAKPYDVDWKDNSVFSLVGAKYVMTFTQTGTNLKKVNLPIASIVKTPLANTAVSYVGNSLYTGNQKGNLISWTSKKVLAGHTDTLWSIKPCSDKKTFLTGANDGKICVWVDGGAAPTATIDLKTMANMTYNTGLRALDATKYIETGAILFGTRGSVIGEVGKDGAVTHHMQGHTKDVGVGRTYPELWGCCAAPNLPWFATCGSDRTVRLWSPEQSGKKWLAISEQFTDDITAVDISHHKTQEEWDTNGFICVGDRKGKVMLLDHTLAMKASFNVHSFKSKAPWVEALRISPDNTKVAVGSHGGRAWIDIGEIGADLTMKKHPAKRDIGSTAVTAIDWDVNSTTIAATCGEPAFMSATGDLAFASAVKDLEWFDWTCKAGWGTQGMADHKSVGRTRNAKYVAAGDENEIQLYRWPCIKDNAAHKNYYGHSSFVTKCRFMAGDTHMISVGGNDQSIMVWETDFGTGAGAGAEGGAFAEDEDASGDQSAPPTAEQTEDFDQKSSLQKAQEHKFATEIAKEQARSGANAKAKAAAVEDEEEDMFGEEEDAGGDQFMAVKPWKGAIRAPSGYSGQIRNQEKAPEVTIEPEWVYGYRGGMSKNNIKVLSDGGIAYLAAGLGVVWDPTPNAPDANGYKVGTQSFFSMHAPTKEAAAFTCAPDVTCMAFSPTSDLIATSESGNNPTTYIWDGLTMQMKHKIRGGPKGSTIIKNCRCIGFSPSGTYLAMVAENDDHHIAVYNAETGQKVATAKGGRDKILDMAFLDDTHFSTVGPKHFRHWTVAGGTIKGKAGAFGKNSNMVGSCAYYGNTCLTGAISGAVYKWTGAAITGILKNHTKLVDAIHCNTAAKTVFTGGRDMKIVQWNPEANYAVVKEMDMKTVLPQSLNPTPRAIWLAGDQLVVGTKGAEIFTMTYGAEAGPGLKITDGHYEPNNQCLNEAWGLDLSYGPEGQEIVVSSSDDGTMRMWDPVNHQQVAIMSLCKDMAGAQKPLHPQTKDLAQNCWGRSVAFHPDSSKRIIAVGTGDNSVMVYEQGALVYDKLLNPRAKAGNIKEWIQDLKFSPDGTKLCVSSHDNFLYMFDLAAGVAAMKSKKFGKSSSFISQFDWSADGSAIRTVDGSYEYLFYDTGSCTQQTGGATAYRDIAWASQSCILGWGVTGVFQPGQDGSDVNHCDFTTETVHGYDYQLLAAGNDLGQVTLMRYPAPNDNADFVVGAGHSSHVTRVKLNRDGTRLYSVGGNDTALIQWKITKK